ncbi:MAG: OB-fold nucleic acid binding domain-containing protein, partial [Planctomycetota bacterium]
MDEEDGSRSPEEPPGQELRYIKGVGPRRAQLLKRLGMYTVTDLLLAPPRRHEDRRERTAVVDLSEGRTATVTGEVTSVRARPLGGRRHLLNVGLADESGSMSAVWFNQPYLADRFGPGDRLILTGKVDFKRGRPQMNSPEFEVLESEEDSDPEPGARTPYSRLAFDRLVPVYPLTEGIGQRFMRRLAWDSLERFAGSWPEPFSAAYRRERQLVGISDALHGLHFPDDEGHARAALRRLAYEELLVLQLILAKRRANLAERGPVKRYRVTSKIDERIRSRLKFTLTAGQERAVAEIVRDLARER